MGTKTNPGEYDCYKNALPDEPMFILLARDPLAPELVDEWAVRRMQEILLGTRPKSDIPMVDQAQRCATDMRLWRVRNAGAWRAKE